MTLEQIEARLGTLMARLYEGGGPDLGALAADVRALQSEIEAAIHDGFLADDPAKRNEVREGMGALVEMVSDPGTVQMMRDAAANPPEPQPAILDAIDEGDVVAVRAALTECDVNARFGEYGATPLYRAMSSMEPRIEVMEALLDAGADPRLGVGEGNVLHGMGFGRYTDLAADRLLSVVRRCVALGADLEQRSEHLMWTPLICAASEWNPVATEVLLLAGADATARAGDVNGVFGAGQTAAHFAEGDAETQAILQRHARPQ